ncbi:hypothetical protein PRIPAC_81618 [Pristionchus pacificus]|uniref:BPTI/Kunitz inhibitor domain-containing protein n=1 Tax=Pristionchus pacificus TaxID=54126 RepID=A0A2A6BI94_PRIPA|nr:hypothetical protein PRIPAC_81618 [Pristionchus pacificus]|eukprot:PDM65558.1 hypothetical protein PRIPAC_52500 [Pristionchus pacificus]
MHDASCCGGMSLKQENISSRITYQSNSNIFVRQNDSEDECVKVTAFNRTLPPSVRRCFLPQAPGPKLCKNGICVIIFAVKRLCRSGTASECNEACTKPLKQSVDRCLQPFDNGRLRHVRLSNTSRYYYNPQLKKCEQFVYGGSGGNNNRFDTRGICESACIPRHNKKPSQE